MRRFLWLYVLVPKKHNDWFFDRVTSDVMARSEWSLPASPRPFSTCDATQPFITAGSSSPHSTTNGRSFEAIYPTDGRYGSVMNSASLWFFHSHNEAWG